MSIVKSYREQILLGFAKSHQSMGRHSLSVAHTHSAFVYSANSLGIVPDEVVRAYDNLMRRVKEAWDKQALSNKPHPSYSKPCSASEDVARLQEADRWADRAKEYSKDGKVSLGIACAHRSRIIGADHDYGLTDEVIEAYDDLVKEVEEISTRTTATLNEVSSGDPLEPAHKLVREFEQIVRA